MYILLNANTNAVANKHVHTMPWSIENKLLGQPIDLKFDQVCDQVTTNVSQSLDIQKQ